MIGEPFEPGRKRPYPSRLADTATAVLAASLLIWPLATIAFILGVMLVAKDEPGRGVIVMALALLVLYLGVILSARYL